MPSFHPTSRRTTHHHGNFRPRQSKGPTQTTETRSKYATPTTTPIAPFRRPKRNVSFDHHSEEETSSNSSSAGSVGSGSVGSATHHGFGETIIPRYSQATPGFLAVEDDQVVFLFAPQVVGSIMGGEKSSASQNQDNRNHYYRYHNGPPRRQLL